MKRTTIILLLMCLALLAARCQEPDTICTICYSEADMKAKNDSIQLLKDINHSKDIILAETIDYFETVIASLVTQPDSFNISTGYNGIEVEAIRNNNTIRLSIIQGDKRSHLGLIDGEIQVRFADQNIQEQTWLPEQRTIKY